MANISLDLIDCITSLNIDVNGLTQCTRNRAEKKVPRKAFAVANQAVGPHKVPINELIMFE